MRLPVALNWLRPPQYADPTMTRRATTIWGLLWSLLLLSLPILAVITPGGTSFRSLMMGNVIMAILLVVTRLGYIRPVSFAIPTALTAIITFVSINSDGIHDVAVVGYFLVIAMAALLIGRAALFGFTVLVIVAYSAMGIAEINGLLVNDFAYKTGREDIIIFAAISALFAILLRATLQYLIDNLQRAEASEQELAGRNVQIEMSREEIQQLNADLEQRIAERMADLRAATEENEQLYMISRDINGAQDYVALVDAVAKHLDQPEYGVTLSLFDTFDKTTGKNVNFVAQRRGGKTHAVPIENEQESGEMMRQWLPRSDMIVINDVAAPPAEIHPEMLVELRARNLRAFMMAELTVNARVLGYMMLGLPYAHTFSMHDIRVLRASADLIASAVERMRLYVEQVHAAERLREADEIKGRFMANMSHELRTPLNAILNFTRFVSSGMLGTVNAEQMDALSKTISSGKHLLSLINDVLDVTKIESQMLTLFVEADVDPRLEVEAAASAGEGLLVEKPVKLVREIASDLPLIAGDRRRLRQVFLNLVSNACKFTDEGTVTIIAKREDERITIEVRDTGPGIAEEDLEVIFEPFRQSRRGMLTSGGTGLGLAIARRLVEAHEGTLTVESALGLGSTFKVVVPITSEALRAQIVLGEATK